MVRWSERATAAQSVSGAGLCAASASEKACAVWCECFVSSRACLAFFFFRSCLVVCRAAALKRKGQQILACICPECMCECASASGIRKYCLPIVLARSERWCVANPRFHPTKSRALAHKHTRTPWQPYIPAAFPPARLPACPPACCTRLFSVGILSLWLAAR